MEDTSRMQGWVCGLGPPLDSTDLPWRGMGGVEEVRGGGEGWGVRGGGATIILTS